MAIHPAIATKLPETSRRVRRRAHARAGLLSAAKRLLAARGFHATKVADIAAAADVGTGTFYLHFRNKEALFADLVRETAIRAKEEMDRAKAPHADPRDKTRAATETFFRFADSNREVFKILFGHSAQFDALLREVNELFVADIEEDYALGVAANAFEPLRPAIVAQAVVGMLSQVVSWWVENEAISVEEITQTVYRMLNQGYAVKENAR